ncbi:MAG TPA: hypothetical protein VHA10_07830 [Hypericibacter adhaerens]|uniref:hypothetical protein n=1 Tax=Hypericibacter adhaerens TaxID=2602016 RepID=UPI002B5E7402|nr:hypothetical protein [Hypericibacter adhaerens]HWA43104.1 hypothetical protein [Hypericibacter adhaerens]
MLKILVFFLWFFGVAIGLPALVLGLIKRGAQPDFAIDRDAVAVGEGRFKDPQRVFGRDTASAPVDAYSMFPLAIAASAAVYPDGTRVLITRGPDKARSKLVMADFFQSLGAGNTTQSHSGSRFTARSGEVGWIALQDDVGVAVLGPTREAMEARRAALSGFRDNPKRTLGNKIDREYLPYVLGALLIWCLLVAAQFGRMAAWVGGENAPGNVPPVASDMLAGKILALNQQDVPFTVTPGDEPNMLVVDWRYADAKWADLMRAHGMEKSHRLVLRLDPGDHTARSRDYESEMAWSAGAGGADLSWSGNLGITFFKYEYEKAYGLFFENGTLKLAPSYEYRFDLDEMKAPIIALIVGSGWNWRPVVSFWRPFGG